MASGEVIERGILVPRRTSISPAMTETTLRELADDIREHGLNDSIVVAVYDPDIEAIFNEYGVIEGTTVRSARYPTRRTPRLSPEHTGCSSAETTGPQRW